MSDKLEILKRYWGHPSFRPRQEEIIDAVLEGQDTLALLPTGGGKSICYQLPTLVQNGKCLVISPLISLMQDQVENLRAKDIKAIAITSGESRQTIDIQLENAVNDPNLKFIYVSPERLKTPEFKERFKRMNISLIAIDESHCISQWGYDFRPAYLEIANIRTLAEDTPIIALTATATEEVMTDIVERLELKDPKIVKASFERANLAYRVIQSQNKEQDLLGSIQKSKSGIVYCYSRKQTVQVAKYLQSANISADFYHGGMNADERATKQRAWQSDELEVMVATTAFGMGIDKPNVRFVIHYDLPENLESYSQESGRAGRDGNDSVATLLYNSKDEEILTNRIKNKFPDKDFIKQTYELICSSFQIAYGSGEGESFNFNIGDFCQQRDLNVLEVYNSIKFLEMAGFMQMIDFSPLRSRFRFKVPAKELYGFRIKDDQGDQVIQFLLRTHIGILNDFVVLNENKICTHIGVSKTKLNEILLRLAKLDLADYEPSSNSTSIRLITERLTRENISIPADLYLKRKELAENKLDSMLEFVKTENCKSVYLRNYFGDNEAEKCGICSSCIGQSGGDKSAHLRTSILNTLDSETVETAEVIKALPDYTKEEVLQSIRLLSDDKLVELDSTGRLIKKLQP